MGVWPHSPNLLRGSNPNPTHSWVTGALDSAWRAVDQYLALNHAESHLREEFWRLWGETEYWDEASNEKMVKLNRELTERHLVIALYKDGVTLEPTSNV